MLCSSAASAGPACSALGVATSTRSTASSDTASRQRVLVRAQPQRSAGAPEDETAPTPLSFGWGAHHCLGAHLARAEGEIVFGSMLQRFDSISLDTEALGATGGVPHYREAFTLRGLESLPVTVERR